MIYVIKDVYHMHKLIIKFEKVVNSIIINVYKNILKILTNSTHTLEAYHLSYSSFIFLSSLISGNIVNHCSCLN